MACSICQDTLAETEVTDTIGMQKTSMECGCVFHNHCLAVYVAARGEDERAMPTVPCPNCRQTAVDIREKGIPMGSIDLIDGVSNPDQGERTISLPSSPEDARASPAVASADAAPLPFVLDPW